MVNRRRPSGATHTLRKTPISEGHFVLVKDKETLLQCTISLSRKNTSPNSQYMPLSRTIPGLSLKPQISLKNPQKNWEKKCENLSHLPDSRTRIVDLAPNFYCDLDHLWPSLIRRSFHASISSSISSNRLQPSRINLDLSLRSDPVHWIYSRNGAPLYDSYGSTSEWINSFFKYNVHLGHQQMSWLEAYMQISENWN